MRILLLTLDTFSRTGGIQQFNRSLHFALSRWLLDNPGGFTHVSLADKTTDEDPKYTAVGQEGSVQFQGFNGKKISFVRAVYRQAKHHDLIIFGHAHLLSLLNFTGFSAKKTWLIAHGIEVWGELSFFKKNGLKKVSTILCVSHFTKSALENKHHIPAEKLVCFPNCLDPFFAEMPLQPVGEWNKYWRIDPQKKYLLTVARISATETAKGYDSIIRLLPALAEQCPNMRYILAGKSDEPEYERIRILADSLGVSHLLLMPGFVQPNHLPSLYNLASVFVMPSQKEGFGIVYIEAAWWGCPVVAYDSGGVKEALMDGALGSLIQPGDENALKEAILNHLKNTPKPLERNRDLIQHAFGFDAFQSSLNKLLIQV